MLKLICTEAKPAAKFDYEIAYLNGLIRALEDKIALPDKKEVTMRIVFYVVKYFSVLDYRRMDRKGLESLLIFNDVLLEVMHNLSPADLISVFPIDKKYDGHKYETKDYFSTIEAFQSHGMNEPIRTTENATSILWDFANITIMMYQVKILGIISSLRKMDTGKELWEEFFENEGIQITQHDINGNKSDFAQSRNVWESPGSNGASHHLRLIH
jgi:hypothetical protein